MVRFIQIAAIYFFLSSQLASQAPNYQITQYTLEDGLPSNECHAAVQDSLGYIWIATDRGLSRFDGYGFKNYGIKEGLGDLSCLQMQIDRHNDIWLRTYSDKFYKYISSEDTIIAYPFNNKIEDIKSSLRSKILEFYVSAEDTLYVSISNYGLLKISENGQATRHRTRVNNGVNSFMTVDYNVITYTDGYIEPGSDGFFYFDNGAVTTKSKLAYGSIEIPFKYRKDQKRKSNLVGFQITGNKILYYNSGHLYLFKDSLLHNIIPSPAIKDLVELPTSEIMTAELEEGGVKYYNSIQDIESKTFTQLLPEISASKLLFAKDELLIVTTLEDGVFILKPSEINQVNSPTITNKNLINIQGNRLSEIFINQDYTSVINYSIAKNEGEVVYSNSQDKLFHLLIDYSTGIAFYSLLSKPYFIKRDKKYYIRVFEHGNIIEHAFSKRTRLLANGSYIILTAVGIIVYDNLLLSPIYQSYPTIRGLDAIDVIDYNDDFLLGCRDGLYVLKDYDKIKLDSIHSFFNYRVNSIERYNCNYYLGTLGGGLGIWDGEKDLQIIDTDKGLISNNIERVVVDSSGTIIVCTKAGISVLSGKDSSSITNYSRKHGLPSNEVNDALIINDTIVVATSSGLAYIADANIAIAPKVPLIESFLVNNFPWESNSDVSLSYDQNSISISYKALDFTQDGDIDYSYSLNGEEWQYTTRTEVDFASLQPRDYEFSVRAANRDGVWSNSKKVSFTISPPWWKTLWFYFLCIIALLLGAIALYRNRINSINERNEIEQEINQLERSALQAQMNPHFIFNSLNSIQSFIMSNEKENAMVYLARFARLVRQNLRASSDSCVALDIEIAMLTNYMELEKMRFHKSFDYKISIEENIEAQEVIIPPLIIQPYVENAILHGMRQKKGDGLIELNFAQSEDLLHIQIKDNGPGIDTHKEKKATGSLGMSITQKRLAHLSKLSGNNFHIDTNSNSQGTTITIAIKPLN